MKIIAIQFIFVVLRGDVALVIVNSRVEVVATTSIVTALRIIKVRMMVLDGYIQRRWLSYYDNIYEYYFRKIFQPYQAARQRGY